MIKTLQTISNKHYYILVFFTNWVHIFKMFWNFKSEIESGNDNPVV